MSQDSVKDFYNRQYSRHRRERTACPNALHDLDKARRRVSGVIRAFNIGNLRLARVLDVGSGLGYYTKALSLAGADVLGIDFSEAAVAASRSTFPECKFICGSWPSDVALDPGFDLIWMVNFSMMNTFDIDFIEAELVRESLRRLRPAGTLVVGWNTDFSGRVVDGYSHWPLSMLRSMRGRLGLSEPIIAEVRSALGSWLLARFASTIGRSIPIFMMKRQTPLES